MSFNFLKQSSSANGTVKFSQTHTEIPWLVISKDWKSFDTLVKRNEPVWYWSRLAKFTRHSLHSSRVLNLTVDSFQANNTLISSHGLSYNCILRAVLFFFRSREGSARTRARRSRETGKTRAAPRDIQSRTFSHELGHLSISRVLLDGPRKKRDYS